MNPVSRFLAGLSSEERSVFRRQLAAIFVIITLLNLGFYWQRAFREMAVRRNVPLLMRGWDGLAWYVWMPAAPATLLLLRRYPINRDRMGASVARLVVGGGAIYFVVTNTRYLLRILPNVWLPDEADLPINWPSYVNTQVERTPLDFLTYCGLFAASFAVDYYYKFRHRADEVLQLQLRSAQLQAELVKFQLTALRGQLHPHFLFNSFNAIATLVRQKKNDEAVETIAQLGELLRFVMEKFDQQELPFERELEFIRCYLEVERVRFGEKLNVVIEVEPDTLGWIVPSLLLQPLVENAIKHGIAQRVTPGRVFISAQRRDDWLVIEVKNDGPEEPRETMALRPSGIGLRNTRSRLEHVYGPHHTLRGRAAAGRRDAGAAGAAGSKGGRSAGVGRECVVKKLRVLIVDDEALAREGAALLLRQDPEIEVIGECDNGRSALEEIRALRPDLVLLDIQMPQRGGLEVLEQLEEKERPAIIFITAYDEHAVRAFELCALDYLLKPFRDQRFHAAVARAKDQVRRTGFRDVQLQAQSLIEQLRRLEAPVAGETLTMPETSPTSSRLVVKIDGEHVFVEQSEIAWIEAQGDFIKLRVGSRTQLARESLQSVEKRLNPSVFVRVHRSFIVNSACISKITPALYGDHIIVTRDGAKLRLSRTYRNQLKRLLAAPPAKRCHRLRRRSCRARLRSGWWGSNRPEQAQALHDGRWFVADWSRRG